MAMRIFGAGDPGVPSSILNLGFLAAKYVSPGLSSCTAVMPRIMRQRRISAWVDGL